MRDWDEELGWKTCHEVWFLAVREDHSEMGLFHDVTCSYHVVSSRALVAHSSGRPRLSWNEPSPLDGDIAFRLLAPHLCPTLTEVGAPTCFGRMPTPEPVPPIIREVLYGTSWQSGMLRFS